MYSCFIQSYANNNKKNNIYQPNIISRTESIKYKMWCRIEEKNESSDGILCNLKYSLKPFYFALKRSKYKRLEIDVFKNGADKL